VSTRADARACRRRETTPRVARNHVARAFEDFKRTARDETRPETVTRERHHVVRIDVDAIRPAGTRAMDAMSTDRGRDARGRVFRRA
jgi:hypothetical protein